MKNKVVSDYHIHSKWSPDSKMSIQDALDHCNLGQIQDIAFTEHMDLGIQHKKAYHRLDDYIEEVSQAKHQYPMMHILTGIEAGVNASNLTETEQLLRTFPLEYIVFSLHASKGAPFCSQRAYQKAGHEAFLRLYFEEMLYIVTHGQRYHALGHLDYILRYQSYTIEEFLLYEQQIKEILNQLILHHAALEINTKGIQSLNRPHPPMEILKWYVQLGGSLVVIGSDAHKASQIGEHFHQAKEWIQSAGLEVYHTFEKGNWIENPL